MRAIWALGLVGAVALADLWISVRPDPGPVMAAEMTEAVAVLKKYQKAGDLLVHSPLLGVEELAALGPLIARPDLPAPSLRDSRRILLLDRRDAPMYGFRTASETVAIGDLLVLKVFEPTGSAEVPLFDLISSIDSSTLRIVRGERVTPCTTPRGEGGFACPGEPEWLYAAPRMLRIGGQDQNCVWAHPTTGGSLVFQIPAQPEPVAPKKLELKLSAGLTDDAVTGTADGASVRIQVNQGRVLKGQVTVPNQLGWHEGRFSLTPGVPVELVVTTPRDGRRHHCLNVLVVEVGP